MEMKQNEMKSICAPTPAAQKNTVKKAGKTSSAVWDLGTGSRDAWTFTRSRGQNAGFGSVASAEKGCSLLIDFA